MYGAIIANFAGSIYKYDQLKQIKMFLDLETHKYKVNDKIYDDK